MATVTTTKRHVLYDVEIREGKRLVRIIGEGLRYRRAIQMRDFYNELDGDESVDRAVIRKRQCGTDNGRFQVLSIECPEGWKPSCWTDLPPAPFKVLDVLKKSCTLPEAEGFCFGFNGRSKNDSGHVWAIAVRIHVMTIDVPRDNAAEPAGKVTGVSQVVLVRTVKPDGSEPGERHLLSPGSARAFVEMYNSAGHSRGGARAEAKRVSLPCLTGEWDGIESAAHAAKGGDV